MLKARFAFVTLCAIVVTGCEVPPPPNAVWVTIPSGDSIGAVAESLAAHDIVRSAERFERFARVNRRHLGVQAGTYPLRPRMPMGEVLATLRRGTHPVTPVTIRERATLAQVARRLERSLGVEAESILVAAHDTSLLKRVGSRGESLEGYLFPTQYYFPTEATAHELVRQMVDTFEARWMPHWGCRGTRSWCWPPSSRVRCHTRPIGRMCRRCITTDCSVACACRPIPR
jgi:cell division protein YceG involved in septum cleavage